MLDKKKAKNLYMIKKKIIIVAGGSGGHVFPAIAIIEEIRKKSIEHLVLTDERCEHFFLKNKTPYELIDSSALTKNILLLPIFFLKIIRGFLKSLNILSKNKQSVIIGFGGYTSLPSIMAAKTLKIPIIIHEQNSVMGKANRFLSKFSNYTALTFRKTKFSPKNGVYTGIPIRKKFFSKNTTNIKKKKKIKILILGGSQGAKIFSEIIPKVFSLLEQRELSNFILNQQSRKEDIQLLNKFYSNQKIQYSLKEFFDNIPQEMSDSDIIISRCGASTLAEIQSCSKFSFLFPLPTAKDNHQFYNAKQFSLSNNCIIYNEQDFFADDMVKRLKKFCENRASLEIKKKIPVNESPTKKIMNLLNKTIKNETCR